MAPAVLDWATMGPTRVTGARATGRPVKLAALAILTLTTSCASPPPREPAAASGAHSHEAASAVVPTPSATAPPSASTALEPPRPAALLLPPKITRPLHTFVDGTCAVTRSPVEGATFFEVSDGGRHATLRLTETGELDRTYATEGAAFGRAPAPLFFHDGRKVSRWDGAQWTRERLPPNTDIAWARWTHDHWLRVELPVTPEQGCGARVCIGSAPRRAPTTVVVEDTRLPPPGVDLGALDPIKNPIGVETLPGRAIAVTGQIADPAGDLGATALALHSGAAFPRQGTNAMWARRRGDRIYLLDALFLSWTDGSQAGSDDLPEQAALVSVDEAGRAWAVTPSGSIHLLPASGEPWHTLGRIGGTAGPVDVDANALGVFVWQGTVLRQIVGSGEASPIPLPEGLPAGAWILTVDSVTGDLWVWLYEATTRREIVLTTNERVRETTCRELVTGHR